MTSNNTLLHRTLTWNAAFSGLSAILMTVGAAWLTPQLGLPGPMPIYDALRPSTISLRANE